jgi:hypothetical protein
MESIDAADGQTPPQYMLYAKVYMPQWLHDLQYLITKVSGNQANTVQCGMDIQTSTSLRWSYRPPYPRYPTKGGTDGRQDVGREDVQRLTPSPPAKPHTVLVPYHSSSRTVPGPVVARREAPPPPRQERNKIVGSTKQRRYPHNAKTKGYVASSGFLEVS